MKNTTKIVLNNSDNTFARRVRSMLDELEGVSRGKDRDPRWPTRFITYQKAAPLKDKGRRN